MTTREHNSNALRTWIDIDTNALAHNYRQFRSLLSDSTKLAAVVKSNAYGHSIVDYAQAVEELGVDWLLVDSLIEGIRLRDEGIKTPMMVLGYTMPEMYEKAAAHDISITVSSISSLKQITQASEEGQSGPLKIHLKVDTGMHRQGIFESEIDEAINLLKSVDSITLEGLYTHMPNAKNPSTPQYTKKQLEAFDRVREKVKEAGFDPICHAAATSSTIIYPDAHYDMVRVGIGLYGLWPAEQTKKYAQDRLPLKPILSWKTIVTEVKRVSSGAQFGYGLTESVSRDSVMAILPIGYWHGYPRALSSVGHVLVKGKRAKVLGTISMDMAVVDVTDIDGVEAGNEVALIGQDGDPSSPSGQGDEITADELAGTIDTINYEIMTRLNPLIKRFYN